MLYGRSITVLFAIIQILASAVGFLITGCFQLVFAVFGGVENISASLVMMLVKLMFYIATGISLIAQFRFAIIMAFVAAFVGLASDAAALRRGEIGGLFGVTAAFHVMYLLWFIVVQVRGNTAQGR